MFAAQGEDRPSPQGEFRSPAEQMSRSARPAARTFDQHRRTASNTRTRI